MIMKHIHCGKRPFAIRNKKICRNTRIGIDIEKDFPCDISLTSLLAHHLIIKSVSLFRRSHHTFEHLCFGNRFPLGKVIDITVSPSKRIGQFLLQLLDIARQVEGKLIVFPLLQLSLLLLLSKDNSNIDKQYYHQDYTPFIIYNMLHNFNLYP